jgi:hypothetical protein
MSYGRPNGLQYLSGHKLGLQKIVRQHTSYLINTLGTDVCLYTKPEHGQDYETNDAEIAEPEPE